MKITKMMKGSLLALLLLIPLISLIAQVIDPPADLVDLLVRFDVFVASLGGYAVAAIWVTGLLNGWTGTIKSWVKQLVSWVVPVLLVVIVSLLLKLGFLAGQPVINVVIFGLGCGLVSNGIFDIAFVNTMVNWVVSKLGGKTA